MIRTATIADVAALVKVINDAFLVEAFFKIGDRTSAEEVADLMGRGGEFLVIEDAGAVAGCVCATYAAERAYFGMLSIDPARQGQGLGRKLIEAVESRARARGCRFVEIHIVNLREELPVYYNRLGYIPTGELPFSDPQLASRPCYFIVMTKSLGT